MLSFLKLQCRSHCGPDKSFLQAIDYNCPISLRKCLFFIIACYYMGFCFKSFFLKYVLSRDNQEKQLFLVLFHTVIFQSFLLHMQNLFDICFCT